MAARSGKNGSVTVGGDPLAEVTQWSFNPTSNNPSWASSEVPGYKRRVAGVKDGSGTIEAKFHDSTQMASIEVGTKVELTLKVDDTSSYTVPAIIDSINFEVDIDEGEVVSFSADFSTDGAWTEI